MGTRRPSDPHQYTLLSAQGKGRLPAACVCPRGVAGFLRTHRVGVHGFGAAAQLRRRSPAASETLGGLVQKARWLRIPLYLLAILTAAMLLRSSDREPAVQRPSFVLVILDTVRADRLGCYGNAIDLTPAIDRYARGGARFTQAYAQAPWTLPSIASLLTSQWPTEHGAGGVIGDFRALSPAAGTLAEALRSAGYQTGLISNVVFLSGKFGLDQGFTDVDAFSPASNLECRRAGITTDLALDWLATHTTAPFLLVVHYFDPHLIYDPPQPYRARYADPRDARSSEIPFGRSQELIDFRKGRVALHYETVARLAKLYMGEIAYVDREVGRLLDGLRRLGLAERSVVAVVADHGEEFGDHGDFEHGHSFYQELVRVPLILRVPPCLRGAHGLPEELPREVDSTVRLIDLAPTFCELGGMAAPARFRGRSLLPLLRRAADGDRSGIASLSRRIVLMEDNMWSPGGFAYLRGDFKLIRRTRDAALQLFDLQRDPAEQQDLADARPEVRAELLREVRVLRSGLQPADSAVAPALDREDRQRLRSLGYLE
ncbi:MAG: sulfatase-like hydrolase/transferase [Candidatus Eisenbacteria bacterium]|nr:sulfatase-like hydrolase/transferase [Candidatus Eisenbacteria bacterium]